MKRLPVLNQLLAIIKNWLYELHHGHPFLLSEEANIIVKTRLYDEAGKWMDEPQIRKLIRIRIKEMYKRKYPNAKRLWPLSAFFYK